MKWSIRTPVSASTVWIISAGPPQENAALILASPYPGIGTQESRGMDSTYAPCLSPGMCSSMIESVRCAPYAHCEGSPAEIRLSEPSMRMLTGARSFGEAVTGGRVGSAANGSSIRSAPRTPRHRPMPPTATAATTRASATTATTTAIRPRRRSVTR